MAKGGVREGAGRKPTGEVAMEKVRVSLPPEMTDYAEKQGDGNVSAGLRKIITEHMNGPAPQPELQSTAKSSRRSRPVRRQLVSEQPVSGRQGWQDNGDYVRGDRHIRAPQTFDVFFEKWLKQNGTTNRMLHIQNRVRADKYRDYLIDFYERNGIPERDWRYV